MNEELGRVTNENGAIWILSEWDRNEGDIYAVARAYNRSLPMAEVGRR